MTLTQKQENFCLEYLKGGNASEAYRKAYGKKGMASKTINEAASRLLKNGKVLARLEELKKPAIEAAQLSKQWVLDKLKTITERCMQSTPVVDKKGFPVLVELADGTLAPAYEFNAMGANRALELIGKELLMFIDRSESGKPGDFSDLTDDQLDRARIETERAIALAQGKGVANSAGNKAPAGHK